LKKYRIDTLEEMRRVLFFLIWEEAQEIDLFTPADKQYVDVFRRLFIYLTHHNIQIPIWRRRGTISGKRFSSYDADRSRLLGKTSGHDVRWTLCLQLDSLDQP
jgi:hypothetical protein